MNVNFFFLLWTLRIFIWSFRIDKQLFTLKRLHFGWGRYSATGVMMQIFDIFYFLISMSLDDFYSTHSCCLALNFQMWQGDILGKLEGEIFTEIFKGSPWYLDLSVTARKTSWEFLASTPDGFAFYLLRDYGVGIEGSTFPSHSVCSMWWPSDFFFWKLRKAFSGPTRVLMDLERSTLHRGGEEG